MLHKPLSDVNALVISCRMFVLRPAHGAGITAETIPVYDQDAAFLAHLNKFVDVGSGLIGKNAERRLNPGRDPSPSTKIGCTP